MAFKPANDLEAALERVQAGLSPLAEFLRLFCDSPIFVPSGSEILADGSGLQPLLTDRQGVPTVACFTARERIGSLAAQAPWCLATRGLDFLRRMPAANGLVVNPGCPVGFDLTPDGIRKIVEDFA